MITAVILTKNEEAQIKKCIESVKKVTDDIVVVDDYSNDKTTILAKDFGARVFERYMDRDFSEQSNYGMTKSKGEWILFIDADERVSDDLAKEIIINIKNNSNICGFVFKRINKMWGGWLRYGEIGTFRDIRLVKKGSGKWKRRVHPYFDIKGDVGNMKNPILHYPADNISEFIPKINRWSTWHAIANIEEGKTPRLIKIIFWPCAKFLLNFIIRRGFMDGLRGFVFAMFMSFHSYLSWSKSWLKVK